MTKTHPPTCLYMNMSDVERFRKHLLTLPDEVKKPLEDVE